MRTGERSGLAVLIGTLLALLAACDRGPQVADEYLTGDLRARVDALKTAVSDTPTSEGNASERAQLVWEWANAYALAGGMLPVNLTLLTGRILAADHDAGTATEEMFQFLDDSIRELQVKEEDPAAVGVVGFASDAPLVVGDRVTLEQTYTVGSMAMATGGSVLVGRQLMADQGTLQNEDPAADDYVSIRSSRAEARFEATRVPLFGMHGGFRGAVPMPAFRLAEGRLEAGDSFTVVYGDPSGGSRGFRLQSFSTDQLLLPLYVDLEGRGNYFTPRWPGRRVIGGEAVALRGVAPSILTPGERFTLATRIRDRYYNQATGALPEIQVFLNGEAHSVLPRGNRALHELSDLQLAEPGIYRFTFRSADGALAGASNPIWVQETPSQRLYWGETHGHTGFAEGQGSPESYYLFARDDARLDFASLSEHDIWLDDAEWRLMQDLAVRYTVEGEFIAYLGYEWSVARQFGGHHNVFFRTPDHDRVGMQLAPSLPMLYTGLHDCCSAEDVLIIPHAHQAADWTQNDTELEKLVEIYSKHGSFEWFGNLYLKNGFEVGFIAASDDHRSRPGYAHGLARAPLAQFGGLAGVWAPEKTSDALFAALRGLSAYATSGPRIIVDADLNGAPMGTRQDASERRQILCRVSGTSPIDTIEVIKNGDVIFSQSYLSAPLRSRTTLQIGFESSSDVFGGRDNPRPYRVWQGSLDVTGATVQGVEGIGFDNVYLEQADLDPEQENRVRFHAETRGRRDVMLVELRGASASTTLDLHLEATREYGFAPVLVRPAADLPASDLAFRLADLVDGRLETELSVGDHVDRIQIQVVDPNAPMDREFELTDLEAPAAGDYYYLRVTQLDGGRAWSSPFWVGAQDESH